MKLSEVKDLRVKTKIKRERQFHTAVKRQIEAYSLINPLVENGTIEVEEAENEDTRMTQAAILKAVDVGTKKKVFNFDLEGGPFVMNPTRNGRHVVIGGKGGQLSVVDRTTMQPMCDFTVDESVLDVTFLQNYTMFAAAQRKARNGRNPQTGATIKIAARKVARFAPGLDLKKDLNKAPSKGK